MHERHHRSVIKTISWRILATLTTMAIVFAFTHKVVLSLGIGLAEVMAKLVLYYAHERMWVKISWGREKHPLERIVLQKRLKTEDIKIIKAQLAALGYIDQKHGAKTS